MIEPNREIRVSTLQQQGAEDDFKNMTPAERIAMMWQLTVDAWAMRGVSLGES